MVHLIKPSRDSITSVGAFPHHPRTPCCAPRCELSQLSAKFVWPVFLLASPRSWIKLCYSMPVNQIIPGISGDRDLFNASHYNQRTRILWHRHYGPVTVNELGIFQSLNVKVGSICYLISSMYTTIIWWKSGSVLNYHKAFFGRIWWYFTASCRSGTRVLHTLVWKVEYSAWWALCGTNGLRILAW